MMIAEAGNTTDTRLYPALVLMFTNIRYRSISIFLNYTNTARVSHMHASAPFPTSILLFSSLFLSFFFSLYHFRITVRRFMY